MEASPKTGHFPNNFQKGPSKRLPFLIHRHAKCEYNPGLETLTIRMHGRLHEKLAALTTRGAPGSIARFSECHFRDNNAITCSLLGQIELLN